MKSIGGEPSDE